jgi:uncharacterized protein
MHTHKAQPNLKALFWGTFVVVSIVLLGLSAIVHLLTESWWFSAVGYGDVFGTRLRWQLGVTAVTFGGWWLFLYATYRIIQRLSEDTLGQIRLNAAWRPYLPMVVRYGSLSLITLLALFAAQDKVRSWPAIMQFVNAVPFGQSDPLFNQDISFYTFRLPFYEILHHALVEVTIWALLLALLIYGVRGEIRPERGWKYCLTGPIKGHICLLLGLLGLAIAWGFWLGRYELLYSTQGAIFGAGFTDIHARIQGLSGMTFITLAMVVVLISSLWRNGFGLPIVSLGLYLAIYLGLLNVYPWLQQNFIVEPNELAKETPYIDHHIQFTRQAYDLSSAENQSFEVNNTLTNEQLSQNQTTLDNIRLWDYRPLGSTYSSLQTLRPYYRFLDVDIDRYRIGDDYRQVMLSPRELSYPNLPEQAKTWVNQRLIYTHGYGLVMSPVNQVTRDGLPEFLIKDLPPTSIPANEPSLAIDQPRIYYGEATEDYVLTGTNQKEFDYPLGDENAYTTYDGQGGVPIQSFWRRLTYALELSSRQLLFSNYLSGNTKVHYHRPIQERLRTLAPFIAFDSDPYLALVSGRLQWIIDGYTLSNRYPYSEPLSRKYPADGNPENAGINQIVLSRANYVRDAVKAVVDAYDGSVQFYMVNEQEPVLTTYRKAFPSLFKAISEAPEALRSHFRYPPNLFTIQASLYRYYHMERPEVFYNQEDVWAFPTQVSGQQSEVQMEPYYVIMKLPESPQAEYLMILPFTPVNKNNMVAWMAARCDGEAYGKRLVYEFSKQALIYGPRQIDARIDQNPEISQQLTLWNQQGSEVFRGDLLVIPIERSLLYVEPIYLQATGQANAIPELKRVVIAYKDQIVMEPTFGAALEAIFGKTTAKPPASGQAPPTNNAQSTPPSPQPAQAATIQAAVDAYEASQAALQRGDWQAYGEAQKRLGELLKALNQ